MDIGEGELVHNSDESLKAISPVTANTSTETTNEVTSSSMQTGTATPTPTPASMIEPTNSNNNKTLKRCLSVPILRVGSSSSSMTTRSAAAAMAMRNSGGISSTEGGSTSRRETPKKNQNFNMRDIVGGDVSTGNNFSQSIHIGIPRSNPSSREVSPAPVFNIFAPRARRYSASYTPHGAASSAGGATSSSGLPLCLTPRVSQLRQEECVDMLNSREANHEREVHSAMQMSQSWEDLTLVAENWSCKSEELSNPLQVALPTSVTSCSSPSPTSNRAGMRLPYGLSPSPTRRTFATRRSMSPIAMRPSQLGPVKRKFELDESSTMGSNWNVYSQPPLKKIFTESRGSSPICQSPSSICPSPDSGTYDGRITPKLFLSKLCTNNTNNNSACSSPSSSVSGGIIDSTTTSGICSSASSTTSSISGGSEPMCIGGSAGSGSGVVMGIDEGISAAIDSDDKLRNRISKTITAAAGSGYISGGSNGSASVSGIGDIGNEIQPMVTDMQDDATILDDMKSETSSIGGCSSISIESSSCDSASKAAASFLNRLNVDDINTTSPLAVQKSFYINKQGLTGHKKYIVSSGSNELTESISVSSSTTGNPTVLLVAASSANANSTAAYPSGS